jgi:hypothetical protein
MQLLEAFLALCGAIVAVSAAIGVIVTAVKKAKTPNQRQDERIETLEHRVDKHDELLGNDKKRLDKIDEGNRVTQRALLALLKHSLDGNDTDSLRRAESDLEVYLIEK